VNGVPAPLSEDFRSVVALRILSVGRQLGTSGASVRDHPTCLPSLDKPGLRSNALERGPNKLQGFERPRSAPEIRNVSLSWGANVVFKQVGLPAVIATPTFWVTTERWLERPLLSEFSNSVTDED
jgi:hypothetical protein